MKQIRQSVFETNSSSVHSLTMCMKADWDRWMNGEVLMKEGKFLEKEAALKENAEDLRKYYDCSEESIQDYLNGKTTLKDLGLSSWGIVDYWHTSDEDSDFLEGSYYEDFYDVFKTPSGEEVVSFGYFGENR